MKVEVLPAGRDFEVHAGETVLAAALRAGLNLPHSCRGGNCGSCRARLLRGEVAYQRGTSPAGLAPEEAAAGWILLCQATALSDLVVETRELARVTDVQIRNLPVRVERLERLAEDVMALWLRWPAVEPFAWRAGQYVDILLADGRRRSFSIANAPQGASLLELHVRRSPGSGFSASVFTELRPGSLLRIEGPIGQFVLREGGGPLLFVGGGTGHAPLKAMAAELAAGGDPRGIEWWWGVRNWADAYDREWLAHVAENPRIEAHVVLSNADAGAAPPTPGVALDSGLVHEAVLRAHASLAGRDIYLAGPPALVGAARTTFAAAGADPARIYFDSWEPRPAAPA